MQYDSSSDSIKCIWQVRDTENPQKEQHLGHGHMMSELSHKQPLSATQLLGGPRRCVAALMEKLLRKHSTCCKQQLTPELSRSLKQYVLLMQHHLVLVNLLIADIIHVHNF